MTNKIVECVKNIGETADDIFKKGITPHNKPKAVYRDRDLLSLRVEDGLNLEFSAETLRLKYVFVKFIKTVKESKIYKGELPFPLRNKMTKETVRELLGIPTESMGNFTLPVIGEKGGWDAYSPAPEVFGEAKIIFNYTSDMRVSSIHFKNR